MDVLTYNHLIHTYVKYYPVFRNECLVLAFTGSTLEDKEEIEYSATEVSRLDLIHGNTYMGKISYWALRNSSHSVGFAFGVINGNVY